MPLFLNGARKQPLDVAHAYQTPPLSHSLMIGTHVAIWTNLRTLQIVYSAYENPKLRSHRDIKATKKIHHLNERLHPVSLIWQ